MGNVVTHIKNRPSKAQFFEALKNADVKMVDLCLKYHSSDTRFDNRARTMFWENLEDERFKHSPYLERIPSPRLTTIIVALSPFKTVAQTEDDSVSDEDRSKMDRAIAIVDNLLKKGQVSTRGFLDHLAESNTRWAWKYQHYQLLTDVLSFHFGSENYLIEPQALLPEEIESQMQLPEETDSFYAIVRSNISKKELQELIAVANLISGNKYPRIGYYQTQELVKTFSEQGDAHKAELLARLKPVIHSLELPESQLTAQNDGARMVFKNLQIFIENEFVGKAQTFPEEVTRIVIGLSLDLKAIFNIAFSKDSLELTSELASFVTKQLNQGKFPGKDGVANWGKIPNKVLDMAIRDFLLADPTEKYPDLESRKEFLARQNFPVERMNLPTSTCQPQAIDRLTDPSRGIFG